MPSISAITPSTFDSGRSVTLTGSGFGASQGQVLIGGVAQNVNTWTDTGITFTTVRGSQSLGACRVDVVGGGGSSFTAEAGFAVSGTFADGGSITITKSGGGFGTKPNGAKPWLYLPHSADLNPDTTFSRGVSGNTNHVGCSLTADVYPVNGTGSLRCLMSNPNNCPGWKFDSPGIGALYTFSHRKFGYDVLHDAVGTNHKAWRIWTSASISNTAPDSNIYTAYGDHTSAVISPRTVVENVSVGAGGDNADYWDAAGSNAVDAIATDWHTFEQEFKPSSASGVADGLLVSWLNGKKAYVAPALTTHDGTYTASTYRNLFFSQISNNAEPADYFYYGPTLIEDSRCRIIISTEPAWNTSATTGYTRDFSLPTAWADDSVTATLRKGTHASLSGKYLYVVQADGTASKIGGFS